MGLLERGRNGEKGLLERGERGGGGLACSDTGS